MHILLVEDNPGDITLITETFLNMGPDYAITVSTNGQEALSLLKKKKTSDKIHPDLILTDLNLPGLNGFEFLRYVKRDKTLNHIPVSVLSTSSDPRDIERAYENGANNYTVKPSDGNYQSILAKLISNQGPDIRP